MKRSVKMRWRSSCSPSSPMTRNREFAGWLGGGGSAKHGLVIVGNKCLLQEQRLLNGYFLETNYALPPLPFFNQPSPRPFCSTASFRARPLILRGMTQPLHCSQLANLSLQWCCDIGGCVYGLRCHRRNCTRNWSCIAHHVHSLPTTLLSHPPVRSSHG